MTSRSCRVPFAVLLALSISLIARPTNSGLAPVIVDLDAAELAMLEELSEWVETDDDTELRANLRERSTTFEVFRSFHDDAERHARLDSMPFGEVIRRTAARHGVDALLLAAVIEAESSFDPTALSPRGAVGLMQVLPSTAGSTSEHLLDPVLNVDHGARYLKQLLARYDGDLELALAAYNAGPTNVRRYGGVPPFRETRNYVEKVLDRYVDHHRQVWRSSESARFLDPGSDPTADITAGESA
ncbi:MAG: lytic transglycosylase domain-containing protein [Acidobacteriota bacterium]